MVNFKVMHKMSQHAVIVAIYAKHSNVKITCFLEGTRSFVHKVWKFEASSGDVLHIAKCKKHSDSIRTL